MKIKFYLLALLTIPLGVDSQEKVVFNNTLFNSVEETADQDHRRLNLQMHLANRLEKGPYVNLEDVKGSPYYNDSFILGKVMVNGKEVPVNFGLRYNAYNDQIELEAENRTEALIKAVNFSCKIGNTKYVYRSYFPKRKSEPIMGYFQVLTSETSGLLLKQERMKYMEELPAKNSMTQPLPKRFIPYTNYYFLKNGTNTAVLINKKSVLNNFEEEVRGQMKKYIKSQRIDFKNESDLLKLFRFYTSI